MSIKAVTFRGAANFNSNLYALEMKTRFIDQSAADGYFEGYGKELAAVVAGNQITVGSGAFVVQGRVAEIDSNEAEVTVSIENGNHGYVCARIETCPASGTEPCSLIVKTGASLSDISLTREDTYQGESEYQNKVYELPLYSFYMNDDTVTELKRVIQPIKEFQKVYEMARDSKKAAENAEAVLYTHHLILAFSPETGGEITLHCDINSKLPIPITNSTGLYGLLKNAAHHTCTGTVLGRPNITVGIVTAVVYQTDTAFKLVYTGLAQSGAWVEIMDTIKYSECTSVTDTVT